MLPENILAVASSVSADHNYDTLEAVEYANNNDFRGFQAFLSQEIISNGKLRENIRLVCRDSHLKMIAHAPGTLNWQNALDGDINRAAKDLLALENEVLVVHHYDETKLTSEDLKCLEFLSEQGITTCLENYFMLGMKTAERCFKDYLSLLNMAKTQGISCVPVLDIPRLYDAKVDLAPSIALELLEEAFSLFQSLGIPVILHLIDTHSTLQSRGSWCPIGEGSIIPYEGIFSQIRRHNVPIYMVVLEFEDKVNPARSKQFLKEKLFKDKR